MTDRIITVYLNEEDGTAYYIDCPSCHFWKNVEPNIPCRSTYCTYSGVTIKVPVTIQPPLAPACPSDIIFHDDNVGTDGNPIIQPMVSCDLDQLGCGFTVRFEDDEGTPHSPHDFWVTSDDFRRYEALHQAHAERRNKL